MQQTHLQPGPPNPAPACLPRPACCCFSSSSVALPDDQPQDAALGGCSVEHSISAAPAAPLRADLTPPGLALPTRSVAAKAACPSSLHLSHLCSICCCSIRVRQPPVQSHVPWLLRRAPPSPADGLVHSVFADPSRERNAGVLVSSGTGTCGVVAV